MNRFDIGRCHCLQSRKTFCRDLDPCWCRVASCHHDVTR